MAWIVEWNHSAMYQYFTLHLWTPRATQLYAKWMKNLPDLWVLLYMLKFIPPPRPYTWSSHFWARRRNIEACSWSCISTTGKILWVWLSTLCGSLHHNWHFQFSTYTHARAHAHTHTYKSDRQAYEAESLKAAKVPPTIVSPAVRSELAHNTLHLTPGEKEKGRKKGREMEWGREIKIKLCSPWLARSSCSLKCGYLPESLPVVRLHFQILTCLHP